MAEDLSFYEMFVIKKINHEDFCCAISKSTKIPIEKIGNQVDFFDILSEDKYLILGIELNYLVEGYLTFIRLVSTINFQEDEYYDMTAKIALNLGMNVAAYSLSQINDVIVFYPDWNYQKAFDSQEDDDKFIIEVYGDKKNVEYLLKTSRN